MVYYPEKGGVDMEKSKSKGVWRFLILCIQGAIIGTGAILPGVSGGVLCVAFGIYEPMMALLSHPIKSFRQYYKMFIPIVIGGALGFVLLAKAVELLFETSAPLALMLFAGLIFGTVPSLTKKSEQADPKQSWTPFVLALAGGFLLLYLLGGKTVGNIQPNALWYVFCGLIWGLSMVIPGLSSSSLLIFMGLYQPMTAGIAAVDFGVILPLVGGLAITVLLTARLINSLFEKRYALVSRIVLGIMVASTLLILPSSFSSIPVLLGGIACFAAGFAVARFMDIAREKQEKEESVQT